MLKNKTLIIFNLIYFNYVCPMSKFSQIIFLFIAINASFLSIAQCPVVLPFGIDSCKLSAGSVQLGASGSSGYFNWYDANVGGNFLGSGSTYDTPHLLATTTYYVAATNVNNGLDFDGSNDFVSIGNPAKLQITGDMTVEMWLKPDNFSNRKNPYAKAYGGEGTITQEPSGVLNYYYGTSGANTTPYQGFGSSSPLTVGIWNHIAIVRDLTNMQLIWYINGVQTNSAVANYAIATAGALPVNIGAGYVNNYDGQIDELRVWNTARTAAEISTNYNQCMIGTEVGLVAYYKFDDGAGTQLTDLVAVAAHGTLTNMDAATDWIEVTHDYTCTSCESGRTAVTATINGGAPINLGAHPLLDCGASNVLLDAGAGYTNYLWNTGETTQSINTALSNKHWVIVDDGAGCSDTDTTQIEFASGSNNNLDFNGTNQSVSIGNVEKLRITGDMTIEMWVKPDNFSSRKNPYSKAYGGEGTITQETSGVLNYYYGTSGGNAHPYQGFNSSTSLNIGEWNHIAIVRDLTNMQLHWYINGILTNTVAANYAIATAGTNPVNIASGYVSNYDGQIDELKVWSSARTITEIRNYMCSKVISEEPDLAAYYRFDKGSGATLTDYSKYSNDGTLINTPTWTVSSASIGDNSNYVYTNSWGGQSLTHSICSGENLTVQTMTGTPDGVHIYSVGTVPNDVTGIVGLGSNNRYFGVFKVNDVTATYDAVYDYALNPYVDLANDANLLLFKRANNADSPWINTSAVPNVGANTITASASSTEFILGASVSPLPVSLTSFNAFKNDKYIDLTWTTESELNNDFFIIEKSNDGENWIELTQVSGAGNSTSIQNYFTTDFRPFMGLSYYRLIQIDFDGKKTITKHVTINFETENIIVFPNPFNNSINISNLNESNTIIVYAIDGKQMFYGNSNSIDTESWANGIYELIVLGKNQKIVDRFKIVK